MFVDRSSDSNVPPEQQRQCVLQFDVPYDLDHTVLLYYKMTNFFQNHRRYVKSVDPNQLRGDYVSPSSLNSGDCKPITTIDGKAVYPCGLIANSLFNGALRSHPCIATITSHSLPRNRYLQQLDAHKLP